MEMIRKGVFETNSSSTHSLALMPHTLPLLDTSLMPDEEGLLVILGEGFGWEWGRFNNAYVKASYLLTLLSRNDERNTLDNVISIIREQTQANEVRFLWHTSAHVDPQSADLYDVYTNLHTDEGVKEFIFDTSWYLLLGNDNEYPPVDFQPTHRNKAQYRLSIHNYHWDFENMPNEEEVAYAISYLGFNYRKYVLSYEDYYSSKGMEEVIRKSKKLGEDYHMWEVMQDSDIWEKYAEKYHIWASEMPDVDMSNTCLRVNSVYKEYSETSIPLPPLEIPFYIHTLP